MRAKRSEEEVFTGCGSKTVERFQSRPGAASRSKRRIYCDDMSLTNEPKTLSESPRERERERRLCHEWAGDKGQRRRRRRRSLQTDSNGIIASTHTHTHTHRAAQSEGGPLLDRRREVVTYQAQDVSPLDMKEKQTVTGEVAVEMPARLVQAERVNGGIDAVNQKSERRVIPHFLLFSLKNATSQTRLWSRAQRTRQAAAQPWIVNIIWFSRGPQRMKRS